MTPAEIKKTCLYRTVAPCVRKEDREELARMLAMVSDSDKRFTPQFGNLRLAFTWADSPQGERYWLELSHSLYRAGFNCH